MNNDEIRRKILEILYEKDKEEPFRFMSRNLLKEKLNVEDNKLDSNVLYLKEKNLIILGKEHTQTKPFIRAIITAKGKDLVENKEEFNSMFPINITQNIISNGIGAAIGNNNSINISIEDSFKKIYDDIQKQDMSNKEEIIKNVKEIEDELKKDSIDKNKIKKSIDFLKTNASWVIPSVIEIVKNIFSLPFK